ncbi:hypothetical protein MRB53_041467 [Persea americana]|nr:hypothetical protein MRB53_041467 [Persea americana]
MAPLKAGDKFPSDVQFECVHDHLRQRRRRMLTMRLQLVPGAFTRTCSEYHIPPFLQQIDNLSAKGVDLVAVIAHNDAFVMSAWGKINGATKDGKVLFLADTKSFFSKNHGWDAGMGDRNGRWAMIIEKDGTIKSADVEDSPRDTKPDPLMTILVAMARQVLLDSSIQASMVDEAVKRYLLLSMTCGFLMPQLLFIHEAGISKRDAVPDRVASYNTCSSSVGRSYDCA